MACVVPPFTVNLTGQQYGFHLVKKHAPHAISRNIRTPATVTTMPMSSSGVSLSLK